MADARRLFFALWPEGGVAERLHAAARAAGPMCGGRLMRRETLHLTLAFLGDVPVRRLAAAETVAAAIHNPAFDLTIDRLGYWKRNRILWAGCAAPPPSLTMLAAALAAGLRGAGFLLEERPFAAHVTLLRDARCPPETLLPLAPILWPAISFVLVESHFAAAGSHYEILQSWPLGSAVD